MFDHDRSDPAPSPAVRDLERIRDAAAWVFDLDNTLYAASVDLFAQIDQRMRAYIAAFLGLPVDEAYKLQKQYFYQYGTSLRGLMHRHGMSPEPFLAHVHDIDVSVLEADPVLDAALAALPGRKFIHTNASTRHAERVVERLGIARHFDAVFDICEAAFRPKPEPEPYAELVARHGLDPTATVMVEDMARNLGPAAALGMTTVWISNGSELGATDAAGVRIDHVVQALPPWLDGIVARVD
ncbi:MAG: pyrimidine 5'-nucleotidase [Rhodospirillales bacterium]|nr:MAG: pyrimidine 5'-nucleotidase [Rhodospirillales bacterium]